MAESMIMTMFHMYSHAYEISKAIHRYTEGREAMRTRSSIPSSAKTFAHPSDRDKPRNENEIQINDDK